MLKRWILLILTSGLLALNVTAQPDVTVLCDNDFDQGFPVGFRTGGRIKTLI